MLMTYQRDVMGGLQCNDVRHYYTRREAVARGACGHGAAPAIAVRSRLGAEVARRCEDCCIVRSGGELLGMWKLGASWRPLKPRERPLQCGIIRDCARAYVVAPLLSKEVVSYKIRRVGIEFTFLAHVRDNAPPILHLSISFVSYFAIKRVLLR